MKCLRCRHRGSCRLFAGRVARSQYPLRPFGPIPTTTLNVSDRQTRYTRGERVRCGTDSPLSSSPARQKGSRQTNGSRRRELVGLTQKRADLVRVVHCGDANDVATSAPGSFHANKSRGGECAEWVARVQRGRRKQRERICIGAKGSPQWSRDAQDARSAPESLRNTPLTPIPSTPRAWRHAPVPAIACCVARFCESYPTPSLARQHRAARD